MPAMAPPASPAYTDTKYELKILLIFQSIFTHWHLDIKPTLEKAIPAELQT
jgi:hypothetical protein